MGFLTILYLLLLFVLGPVTLAAGMLLQRGGVKPPFKKNPGKAVLTAAFAIAFVASLVNPAVWWPGFFGSSAGNFFTGLLVLSIGVLAGTAIGYLFSETRLRKLGDWVQTKLDNAGENKPQAAEQDK
jgi:hypothetical protein